MKKYLLLFSCCMLMSSAKAFQINWGGLVDIEFKNGGERSGAWVNQTPSSKPTIYTPNIRLFVSSQIADNFFVEGAIQADHYFGKDLSPLFISLFTATYLPFEESNFAVTAGRFVNPFGSYSSRILSSENPFVHLPISHAWNQAVDKMAGFRGAIASSLSESYLGQNLVYQRMYSQGLMISGGFGQNELLNYQIAATLAPPSSHFESGMHDLPSVISRIELKPWVGLKFGFSGGYGSYMKPSTSYPLPVTKELSDYRQAIWGSDFEFEYSYFTIRGEFISNKWTVPYLPWVNGAYEYESDVSIVNHFFSAEAIIRIPQIVGSFFGLRFDTIHNTTNHTIDTSTLNPNVIVQSAPNVQRIEGVFGYRLNRGTRLKMSYLKAVNSGSDWDDDVVAIQLSIGF